MICLTHLEKLNSIVNMANKDSSLAVSIKICYGIPSNCSYAPIGYYIDILLKLDNDKYLTIYHSLGNDDKLATKKLKFVLKNWSNMYFNL